jgi:hypothetical protein
MVSVICRAWKKNQLKLGRYDFEIAVTLQAASCLPAIIKA